jgi:hypothetical protein
MFATISIGAIREGDTAATPTLPRLIYGAINIKGEKLG